MRFEWRRKFFGTQTPNQVSISGYAAAGGHARGDVLAPLDLSIPDAKVTQAAGEVFGTGLEEARITQAALEAFGIGVVPASITQAAIEIFGVGGPPETTFENADALIGLTWIEITTRDNTLYVWSNVPLPDPATYYGGWKEPRVIQWGKIQRALSNIFDGQYESSTCTIVVSDTDRVVRGLDNDNQLVNASFVIRMITDEGRRALETPRVVYRGLIRDVKPTSPLQFEITLKDTFSLQFDANGATDQLPKRTITTDDFANCGVDKVKSSADDYTVSGSFAGGVSTVNVTGGVGVFGPGDEFLFSGQATVYTISSSSLSDPETSIDFTPALVSGLSGGETITVNASHSVNPATTRRVPIVYGFITDRHMTGGQDDGDGQGPVIYVGDKTLPDGKRYGEFLWAGHACYSPGGSPFDMLYFWNNALDDMAVGTFYYGSVTVTVGDLATEAGLGGRICIPGYDNWITTNGFGVDSYKDYGGRRYTVLYLRGIFRDWALGILSAPANLGGVPFAVGAYGAETQADGTGSLISSSFQQYKHILQNWAPPRGDGYQSGSWLTSPRFADDSSLSMIDEPSFDAADSLSATYVTSGDGGYRSDFIIGANNEAISLRTLIARLNVSCGCRSGFNRKTQYFVKLLNTNASTTTLATELTWIRDIFAGSWSIVPDSRSLYTAIDYRHTQDYFNRAVGGWRSLATGVTQLIDSTAEGIYGARTVSPELDFYMLRGKNQSTDADDYQQGTDTVASVLSLKQKTNSMMPRVAKLRTGPAGFNYELGDILPLTHYEGLSSTGWTQHKTQIERSIIDPSTYTTEVEAFDVDAIVV